LTKGEKSGNVMVRWGEVGNHPILYGSYSYRLDLKGRIAIPARFREELGLCEGALCVVTPWIEPFHLKLFSEGGWRRFLGRVREIVHTPEHRSALEFFLRSSAHVGTVDGQGRILIPPQLREQGELKEETVIVGGGDHVQIWNPERFARRVQEAQELIQRSPSILYELESGG